MKDEALLDCFWSGREWLNVTKFEPDENQPAAEQLKAFQEHHRKEMEKLIGELRTVFNDFSSAFSFLKKLEGSLLQEKKYQGDMTKKFLDGLSMRWNWDPEDMPPVKKQLTEVVSAI